MASSKSLVSAEIFRILKYLEIFQAKYIYVSLTKISQSKI